MTALRTLTLLVSGLIIPTVAPAVVAARDLTFQDRVRCQESIERVYYAHQIGASRPFEEAVPLATLQKKVATYLKESVALETIWSTRITPDMLLRESERMARQSRAPDRLRELFAALGDDPFLIQECLARPALADRLARNFQTQDAGAGRGTAAGWDAWWQSVSPTLDQNAVRATASATATASAAASASIQLVIHGLVSHGAGDADHCFSPEAWTGGRFGDLPAPNSRNSAVWTGSLMIVWGPTQNGWRYDPAIDFWTPMTTVGVPHYREGHAAVWTGSEMLVWGGLWIDNTKPHGVGYTYPRVGGRYDPVSDTWRLTSDAGAPEGRRDLSAVWTGRRMIVWGGSTRCLWCSPVDNYSFYNSGGQYDPATDTWSPVTMTGAPQRRSSFPAIWSGSEMIVWGGWGKVPGPGPGDMTFSGLDTGGRYDPDRDAWTAISMVNAPSARSDHAAVWTGHVMVVWGGGSLPGDSGGRYDPATDTWTPTTMTGAPSGRGGHSAVWTGDRMIVWGGKPGSFGSPVLSTGGRYDPVEDSWSPTSGAGAPGGRTSHSAVWTGSLMIVWGGTAGFDASNSVIELNTGGRYDPATDTWTPTVAGPPAARFQHTAVWTGNEMIVWGGSDGNAIFNSGNRYNPSLDLWTPTSLTGAPSKRVRHTAVWTGSEMIVWGGTNTGGFNSGARYDPSTDAWTPTSLAGAPSPRADHTAVWTGSEMIVWAGSNLNDGGRYNPATNAWTPMTTQGPPSRRAGATGVWTGREMLAWGGLDPVAGPLDSGGRYDPASDSWTLISLNGAPQKRSDHTAVWTGTEMIVWGGSYQDPVSGGRYDPSTDTWRSTTTTGAPAGDTLHSAVWTGKEMIVWGGHTLSSTTSLDTGARYDPASDSWTPTTTAGAAGPRSRHTAVWTGSEMIVWGGQAGVRPLASGGRYSPGGPIDRSPEPETCNGVDDDCNGTVDEGFDVGASCSEHIDACHALTGARTCRPDGTGTQCSGTTIVTDATPPVLDLPIHLVALATSPAGATVTWSCSAQDACSGPTGVACVPPSGSTFAISPIGLVTTVACSSVDASGNGASGNFEVHVAGAVEQLGDLKFEVQNCHLTQDTAKRFVRSIEETLKALTGQRGKEACAQMDKLTGEVVRDAGKKKPQIPADESGSLLETMRRISAVLGC